MNNLSDDTRAFQNTDKEIWRGKSRAESEASDPDRFYADSLFIPASETEALGINCGGFVIVKPIREWYRLAAASPASQPSSEGSAPKKQCGCVHGDSDPNCKDPLCPNFKASAGSEAAPRLCTHRLQIDKYHDLWVSCSLPNEHEGRHRSGPYSWGAAPPAKGTGK